MYNETIHVYINLYSQNVCLMWVNTQNLVFCSTKYYNNVHLLHCLCHVTWSPPGVCSLVKWMKGLLPQSKADFDLCISYDT